MAKLKHKKWSGATLLETMVALTISVFLFSLVTVLFVQVTSDTASVRKNKAHELLYAWSMQEPGQAGYTDQELVRDEFTLRQKFVLIDSLPGLLKAEFGIYDRDNKLLEEIDRLVLTKNP